MEMFLVLPLLLLMLSVFWVCDFLSTARARRRFIAAVTGPDLKSETGVQFQAMFKEIVRQRGLPYAEIAVDEPGVEVPKTHVKEGPTITLDLSFKAVNDLHWEGDCLVFRAKFAGSSEKVCLPVTSVVALYSAKSGRGIVLRHSGENQEMEFTGAQHQS